MNESEKTLQILKNELKKPLTLENQLNVHLQLSRIYLNLKCPEQAKIHLRAALQINPHQAEIQNNLGSLFYRTSHWDDAIRCFQKAIRLNPNLPEAHFNLGNCYSQRNQFDLAATHYEQTLAAHPNHKQALINLGLIEFQKAQWEKVTQHLGTAFNLDSNEISIGLPLAQAWLQLGQANQAQKIYEDLLTLNVDLEEAHHNLAILALKKEEHEKALAHFKETARINPNNQTANHMIQALTLKKINEVNTDTNLLNPPITPPLAFIRDLFDQYAPYYNQHLREQLDYQVPTDIRNELGRAIGYRTQLTLLDLGCGTGLCGLYCRDLAFHLIGVDISSKMLAIAKNLGAYDQLIEQDILSYLTEQKQKVDVIVAAEVLNYFGDLEPFFQAALPTLNPGGFLIFTVEHETKNTPTQKGRFSLQPTGRIAHDPDYISDLLQFFKSFNITIQTQKPLILRNQKPTPIQGTLFTVSMLSPKGQVSA